jgi:homoaconitase/3-isopropylmalate dehydratase large subunit
MTGLLDLPSSATSATSQAEFNAGLIELLSVLREVDRDILNTISQSLEAAQLDDIPGPLVLLTSLLKADAPSEADAILLVLEKAVDSISHGGLGISSDGGYSPEQYADVLFLAAAHLAALNNAHISFQNTLQQKDARTRPMTLSQKIFAAHSLSPVPIEGLSTGAVVLTGLDWVLASELSWSGMVRTYAELGDPGIWRNDRFWLANDHVAHPDAMGARNVKAMVSAAERAKKQFLMTDYQGSNYTIMHTEFVRERAEPGMLVLGSDSHTCSGGAMSCLSIGLGAADVMMALSLGQTWFKIPQAIRIEFTGRPSRGVSGKDVILHILGKLKRNTVAAERIVEFAGPGCRFLSIDARFAICNMCTEFGAVTGLFVPDDVTRQYLAKRRRKTNTKNTMYLKPDDDAVYAGTYEIDLAEVESTIAVYPEPDHIVPVSEKAGMKLDGVFIGACTTTEEEIVLAALVLKVGLEKKLPLAKGKRHYVPGSLPIVERLGQLGLLEVYEQAGFTRGPPGCSYCVGLSAEKASAGETWLSSQNRNFKNRMGAGERSILLSTDRY